MDPWLYVSLSYCKSLLGFDQSPTLQRERCTKVVEDPHCNHQFKYGPVFLKVTLVEDACKRDDERARIRRKRRPPPPHNSCCSPSAYISPPLSLFVVKISLSFTLKEPLISFLKIRYSHQNLTTSKCKTDIHAKRQFSQIIYNPLVL